MSRLPKIVGFAWGPEKYSDAADRLRAQCRVQSLRHQIVKRPDLTEHFSRMPGEFGDRRWVCRWIPTFLKSAMEWVDEGDAILYLHVDFQVTRSFSPGLFDELDVGLQERWSWVPDAPLRCLAAPIYVRRCDASRRFLDVFEALCLGIDDGNFEHDLLWRTFKLFRKKDRALRVDFFPGRLAGLHRECGAPIIGHKHEGGSA